MTLPDAIAVVGMSGRFPGAGNVEELWDNLARGIESVTFFDDRELEADGVPEILRRHPRWVPAAAVVDGVDRFDATLFDISSAEAEQLDPQHRLFLECAWEALEHAGCDPSSFDGLVGVYGGASYQPYVWNNLLHNRHDVLDEHVGRFNLSPSLATRVSYKLGLTGPSFTIQSGCSTSLVTVHVASHGLLMFECDVALAGAVSLELEPKGYVAQGGVLSPDGHCRAFDAAAGGVVGGSGVALVVLRRLEDALADGDRIYAVLRGSAINNDGRRKVGFTAPSVEGQMEVIRRALETAGIHPEDLSYVEAHGTATALGDAIEIEALKRVFREKTDGIGICGIGSVKTNLGHLDNAAGVTGLIKTALALDRELLPPSLHFERPHPELGLEQSPFYVVDRPTPWPRTDTPRRASVSAFGIGGTNAHVVLEEAPLRQEPLPADDRTELLLLSAATESALGDLGPRLANHLERNPALPLADVAHTLRTGRQPLTVRRAVVARNGEQAAKRLRDVQGVDRIPESTQNRPVGFLFPGAGAQSPGMASGLYRDEPEFRRSLDMAASFARRELDLELTAVFDGNGEALSDPPTLLTAVFAIEASLVKLWRSWGVEPDALLGHSFGEYAAAWTAGVLGLEDGLRVMAERGRLFATLPPGAMLTVPLSEEELVVELVQADSRISITSLNGPNRSVVAGPEDAMAELEARWTRRNMAYRKVPATRAGHSSMVDEILEPYRRVMESVSLQPPRIPILSNVTGTYLTDEESTDPDYWVRQLRTTVRFGDGLTELWREPERVLLEVGPGRTLSSLAGRQRRDRRRQRVLTSLPGPNEPRDDREHLLATAGALWACGTQLKRRRLSGGKPRRKVVLPTYPFERHRFWKQPDHAQATSSALPSTPNLGFSSRLPVGPADATLEDNAAAQGLRPVLLTLPDADQPSRPTPDEIEAARKRLWFRCDETTLADDPELVDELDRLAALHMRDVIRDRDWLGANGEDSLPADLEGLRRQFLCELDARGWIDRRDGVDSAWSDSVSEDSAEAHARWLVRKHPELQGLVELLDHCVGAYPEIFSGRIPPQQVLYPRGSYDFLQNKLAGVPPTSHRNIYLHLAAWIAERMGRRRRLRILEVGAGTGVLTRKVLSALSRPPREYRFTDIGTSFLREADEWAVEQDLPYLTTSRFDVTQGPEGQGLPVASYDLILSLDVVQATSDLRGSLANLRRLLAPGGSLALLQSLVVHPWQHMIYGLSPGWWSFQSDPTRGSRPTLSLRRWRDLAEDAGLELVETFPRQNPETASFGLLWAHQNRKADDADCGRPEPVADDDLEHVLAEPDLVIVDAAALETLRLPLEELPSALERSLARLDALANATAGTKAVVCLLPRASSEDVVASTVHMALEASVQRRRGSDSVAWHTLELAPEELSDVPWSKILEPPGGSSWTFVPEAPGVLAVEPEESPSRALWETPEEQRIAAVWSELLGSGSPSPEENFFDAGGDSLVALRLAARLSEAFESDVSVEDIFQHQTVGGLAAWLSSGKARDEDPAPPDDMPLEAQVRGEGRLDDLLQELENLPEDAIREQVGDGGGS